MNKKQPIEKEQCYTEDTEEKEKKKEKNTSTSLFVAAMMGVMSQGLLGLCCSIETRDCIERITLTAVLFG